MKIAFCGDLMLGSEVDTSIAGETLASWLKAVLPALENATLLVGNLESPCGQRASRESIQNSELIFNTRPSRIVELKDVGFNVLTLANNHILNGGIIGLKETIRTLDDIGIYHTGAGLNLAEAMEPAYVHTAGLTFGIVAFCYAPVAARFTPGVAPCDPDVMRKALALARAKADVVIAALHDGLEYSDVPPAKVRARFRFLAENGADIVVGHHPHVLQGLEWHGNVPIAYSLGDFLFHNSLPHVAARNFSRIAMGRFAPEEIQRDPTKFARGAILSVTVTETRKIVEWHPFRQSAELRPILSSSADLEEDLKRIEELTAALQNSKDPRHELAERVWAAAWWADRDTLSLTEMTKLMLKPKWRYVPLGLKWLRRRLVKLSA